jgi:GGDEF domain-containing protein
MYRGDFLQDLLIGELASFQEWAIFQRERHFRRMLEALQAIAEVYSKQGNYDLAYQFAWRYVNMAPLEESAHRLLMRLLNVTGRRAAALQQYQLCKAFLARELAIEPSPETVKLYEQIKLGLPVERPDTGSLNPAPPAQTGNTGALPTRPRVRPTGPLYDPFTQIPLSTLFMDRLSHALVRMERDHLYVVVCCLAVTIPPNLEMTPEFKNMVMQNFIRRLVGGIRKGDTVGKLRDDEFGILLESVRDPSFIQPLLQKINGIATAPFNIQGQSIIVKVALGSSTYPTDGADPVALLGMADAAMRTARLQQSSFFYRPS